MHSSLIGLGQLDGGINAITEAFLEVLPEGLLVIPSFTYSWCKKEPFDPRKTECPPDIGVYGRHALGDNRFVRSCDPNFAVAALRSGKNDKLIKRVLNIGKSCFGKKSVFDHMHQMARELNGYVLLLGGAHSDSVFRSTFIHYVEEKAKVPSRYLKKFYNPLDPRDYVEQLVRFISLEEYQQVNGTTLCPYRLPIKSDYARIGEDLIKEKIVIIRPYGYSQSRMVPINEFCDFLNDKFIQNPDYCVALESIR